MQTYTHLTDEELARHADLGSDPLTTSSLQTELLKRFEKSVEAVNASTGLIELLGEFHLSHNDTADLEAVREALQFRQDYSLDMVRSLVDALGDFDLYTPPDVRKQLGRLASLDQALQDLLDPLTTLQTLVTTE